MGIPNPWPGWIGNSSPVVRLDWEFQWPGWIGNSNGEDGLGIPMARQDWELLLPSFPIPMEKIPGLGGEVDSEGLSQHVLRFSSLDFTLHINPKKILGYQSQNFSCLQLGGISDHPKSIPKQINPLGFHPKSLGPDAPRRRFHVESTGNLGSQLCPGNPPRNVAQQ